MATAVGRFSNIDWIWPPTRSVSAIELPLYGTCLISSLDTCLKSSPAMCVDEPLPAEPKKIVPGCCAARVM